MAAEEIDSLQKAKDFYTDSAIAAYKAVTRAEARLEEARIHLERSLLMNIDMDRYHKATSKIDKAVEHGRSARAQTGRIDRNK